MMHRSEDVYGAPVPVRTDRFFAAQGAWYFSTREGSSIGPFDDKNEARRGLNDFIEFMTLAEPRTLDKLHNALAS
ncbi:DUF6316 family protein [Dasania marina]|nr:DUF6316 family protein [Dasania marina]